MHRYCSTFGEYLIAESGCDYSCIDAINKALLHYTSTLMRGFQHTGAAAHWPSVPCQVTPSKR
jgi:hypothetical protein